VKFTNITTHPPVKVNDPM